MTPDEFLTLKNAGESDGIERKREYVEKSARDRAELVLDMLSLANAHEQSRRYILYGVNNDGTLFDIAHHNYDDAHFQQQVNELVEHPIRFKYEQLVVQEVTVGAIIIEKSDHRFHVVRKDFTYNDGKFTLLQGDTRIKRGSSKRRPGAYDYDLLKQVNLETAVLQPEIRICFYDGTVRTIADYKRPGYYQVKGFVKQAYSTDIQVWVNVINDGGAPAENVSIAIKPNRRCSMPRAAKFEPWTIRHESSKNEFRFETPLVLHGDSLALLLPRMIIGPDSPISFDTIYSWDAYSTNKRNSSSGALTLKVQLVGEAETRMLE